MKLDNLKLGVQITRCDECEYKQNHIEWISESKIKPPTNSDVLIYSPTVGMIVGWYNDKEKWETDISIVKDVTHWQPLPMPPQEVDNGKDKSNNKTGG